MSEWISIKDRLPDVEQEVIVTNGKSIWIAVRPDQCWIGYDGVCRITHWRKQLELPK